MTPPDIRTRMTIYGSLLMVASAISGDATLMATAGAIGVNWTSERLAALWQQSHSARSPAPPVTRAATRAIRHAVDELKKAYQKEHGSRSSLEPFDLIHACADSVVESAQRTSGSMIAARAEETLSTALDELLHGHDRRAVEFLKGRLLGAVARAFREELSKDPEAWNSFHGMLIERLDHQVGTLKGTLEGFSEVVLRLAQPTKAHEALQGAAERLEALISRLQQAQGAEAGTRATVSFRNLNLETDQLAQAGGDFVEGRDPLPSASRAAGASVSFDNSNVRARTVTQAGGNIDKGSTVVQTGSTSEPEKP
jgi:hypothetical protein